MIEFNQREMITKRSVLSFAGSKIDAVKEEDGIIYVVFKEENNEQQQLDIWVVQMTKDQFSQVRREIDIQPISKEQLKAIHAKEAQKKRDEKESVSIVTPSIPEPEVDVTIEKKTPGHGRKLANKTVLPPEPHKEVKWKDNEDVKEARRIRSRLDNDKITKMLDMIFRWDSKNDYTKYRNANHSLSHLLKKTIPNQFGLPFDSCRRIYLGQSYFDITNSYKSLWKKLVAKLIAKGFHDAVPPYLVKHYGG